MPPLSLLSAGTTAHKRATARLLQAAVSLDKSSSRKDVTDAWHVVLGQVCHCGERPVPGPRIVPWCGKVKENEVVWGLATSGALRRVIQQPVDLLFVVAHQQAQRHVVTLFQRLANVVVGTAANLEGGLEDIDRRRLRGPLAREDGPRCGVGCSRPDPPRLRCRASRAGQRRTRRYRGSPQWHRSSTPPQRAAGRQWPPVPWPYFPFAILGRDWHRAMDCAMAAGLRPWMMSTSKWSHLSIAAAA